MSTCLKCGASLPPVGDCPTCDAASQSAARAVPNLLDRDIHIDRRRPDRREDGDSEAVTIPAGPMPASPPGMMARQPAPPGMTPALRGQAAPPPSAPPSAPAFPSYPRPGVTASVAPPPARPQGAPGLPVLPPQPRPPAVATVAAPRNPDPEEDSIPVDIEEEAPAPVQQQQARPVPPPAKSAPVPTPAPVSSAEGEVHARPASLWRRLLAFGVDACAIFAVVALYLLLASSVAGVQRPESTLTGLDAFLLQVRSLRSVLIPGVLLLVILSLAYCAVAAFLWNGRTLGRRILGLRLVDTRGQAPAPARAVVRALLSGVSFGFFLAGFWMALFDRRGQTLHDKLTSTYVVQPS
ncbi:MAG: RDD family protein [Cystobacter sp.]